MRLLWVCVAATFVSMVAGGCWSLYPSGTDYLTKCEFWWKKAKHYSYRDMDSIKGCINLIEKKCEGFLSIVRRARILVIFKEDGFKWEITTRAKRNAIGRGTEEAYYTTIKKTAVCVKDRYNLGNCDYWWSAARELSSYNYLVDRCIKLMEKECPSRLTKVLEKKEGKESNKGTGYEVSLTVKYMDGTEVSFKRYIKKMS